MTLFPGFAEPKENYYRLPNNWFEQVHLLRETYGTRLAAPIKLLEYVLKHTWGYQRFDGEISLTAKEIHSGRFHRGKQVDHGTGLSENSVQKSAQALVEQGYLELILDETDKARRKRAYRPRVQESEEAEFDTKPFEGFASPRESYFKIPKRWTDLTRDIKSATLILTVEYFFRHAWGYHNSEGVWMEAEDIANGRRYRDGRRYDPGTRFDVSSIHRTLQEAVERKLLVWTDENPRGNGARLYNLRMEKMKLSEEGEYLGPLPWLEEIDDLEEVSRNLEVVKSDLGEPQVPAQRGMSQEPGDNLEEVTCKLEAVNGKVEAPKSDLEGTNCNPEARTATGDTIKDTSEKDTSLKTPATTPRNTQARETSKAEESVTEAAAVDFPPELQAWKLDVILETEAVPPQKRQALLQAIQKNPELGFKFLARMLEGYEKASREKGRIHSPIFYALRFYLDTPLNKYLELAHYTPEALQELFARGVYASPPAHLKTTLANLKESEFVNLLHTLKPAIEEDFQEDDLDEERASIEDAALAPLLEVASAVQTPSPKSPTAPDFPTRKPSSAQEAWQWITRTTQIERPIACFSAFLEPEGLSMSFKEAEAAHHLLAQLQQQQGALRKIIPGFALKMEIFDIPSWTFSQTYKPPSLKETLALQL